ncbi:MAG: DUF2796 domain-containing protein [Rubrivivax sp.]|nr:DUF2796 domain-containing protein [Rubrivivax sp.]
MLCSPAWAGKAHEHGLARLDIGVEAGRITLNLEVPLADLVGFERAPRTDAERAAVVAALARLQDTDRLVRIDGHAGCGAGKVSLTAPVWGVGGTAVPPGPAASAPGAARAASAPGSGARDAHADLEATYEFRCTNAPRAGHVELGLFEAFARLRRVEVQAVTSGGQMKLVLRRPQTRVGLAR